MPIVSSGHHGPRRDTTAAANLTIIVCLMVETYDLSNPMRLAPLIWLVALGADFM